MASDLNHPYLEVLVEKIRMYMRDFPELNRLTDGMDHSPRHIAWAVLDTLSDWASTPPFIGQSLDMIQEANWEHVFIRGAAVSLLESLMFLHMRNYLAYSDGGMNVKTENPQMLQAAINLLRSTYEQKKLRVLIAKNIQMAMGGGGIHSEYAYVNTWLGPR